MTEMKLGELAALGTAVFWTITAMCFEFAGKRVGSLSLNLLRLVIGFVFLCLFSVFTRGMLLPIDAGAAAWLWLTLSGLIGFVLGDLLLFQAFIEIGARTSMLIYASVPPLTALIGWVLLGETLSAAGLAGMLLTVSGICLVVLRRAPAETGGTAGAAGAEGASDPAAGRFSRVRFAHPVRGVLFAFGGSLGQAVGLILSKIGAPNYNAFSATQVRVLAGIAGFALVVAAAGRLANLKEALRDRAAMAGVSLGAFFGPFLGVSLGLVAVQNTSAGVASTIMAITPVLIIVPSVLIFKERVTPREVLGALIAISGVAVLFLT